MRNEAPRGTNMMKPVHPEQKRAAPTRAVVLDGNVHVTTRPEGPPVASTEGKAVAPSMVSSIAPVARSRLVTVDTETLLAEVATALANTQISMVVVCDAKGVAVGVITETMLVRQLGFGNADVFTTRAGEVMSREFTTCKPTDSLPAVLGMMHLRGLIHVPIVDADNRPLGLVNARDGLRALLAAGHHEESLLRNYVTGVGYQ